MRNAFLIGAATIAACAGLACAQEGEATDEAAEVDAPPTSFFSGWEGTVSLGLYGSDGNSDEFDFRAESEGERDTEDTRATYRLTYSYGNDNDGISENEAAARARHDWKIPDSKWFAFLEGQFDYDEFEDWDTRVSVFAGPGYVWVENEKQRFMTRAGVGATREIGGSDNAWRAEGIIGVEYRRQLTERQQINASAEAYPDLGDSRNWRVESRATWEVLVDPEVNLTLQVGVENDYDTDPGGVERSDTDYFILLTWSY